MHGTHEKHGPKLLKMSLRADESGIALIYVTVALPIIIGFALLAIDVGRYMTLNSSLQHGADALALAGAAELDGRPDAISRSEGAMKEFVKQNTALFTSSVANVDWSAVSTCYLSSLPSKDTTAISSSSCLAKTSASDITTNSPSARFVQVVVNPKTYNTIFPATFIGAISNTVQTQAEAVAGFQAVACNFTPLFMCNPFEPTIGTTSSLNDYGLNAFVSQPSSRRKAIRFIAVATGSTATATPGQYGFLDPQTGNGKKALGDEIASVSPDACYIQNKLDTKTGDMSDLRSAFNTRFDLYKGSYKKTDYPPAGNVRKGFITATYNSGNNKWQSSNNACNDAQLAMNPDAFLAMPVDSCFKDNSCEAKSGYSAIGNGDWNWDPDIDAALQSQKLSTALASAPYVSFTKYWTTNFITGASAGNAAAIPSPKDLGLSTTDTTPYTDANVPPRYDVYKYENTTQKGNKLLREFQTKSNVNQPKDANGVVVPGSINYNLPNSGEVGPPQCSTPGTDNPDRRIVYGAIINCRAEGLRPGQGGYTAFAFGKFFMIRPMPVSNNSELWLELVDVVRPGDGTGVARDKVQLYR